MRTDTTPTSIYKHTIPPHSPFTFAHKAAFSTQHIALWVSICIHTYKQTTTPYIRIDTFLYLNKTPPYTHSTMEPWKYAQNNALYTQLCLHIFTQHRLIHTTQRILIRTQRCRIHTMMTFTFAHNAALYTHKRPRFTHTHTHSDALDT